MHRKETSVVFYEDYSKDIFTTLSTEEINLFYELLEVAAQQFLGSYAKEFSIKIKKFQLKEKLIFNTFSCFNPNIPVVFNGSDF